MNKYRSTDGNFNNHWPDMMTVTILAGNNHQWMLKLVGENYVEKQDICISLRVSPYKIFVDYREQIVIW